MRETALLFEPVVDIRDVLESFLVDDVLLADWQATLTSAAARISQLAEAWSDDDLSQLADITGRLASRSILADAALARLAADNAARVLEQVRIPGVPRPEDPDWAF